MDSEKKQNTVVEISDLDWDLERSSPEDKINGPWDLRRVSPKHAPTSLKYFSIAMFVLHNSILVLIMHYSRIAPQTSDHRYLPSTVVLLVEIIKFIASISVSYYQASAEPGVSSTAEKLEHLRNNILSNDCWKLAVPAALWTLQNSILYIAISNLDAVSFQVTYQLKILATALFSLILLGRKITPKQWLALILLTCGVAIVQYSGAILDISTLITDLQARLMTLLSSPNGGLGHVATATEVVPDKSAKTIGRLLRRGAQALQAKKTPTFSSVPIMNPTHGIIAVLAACLISSLTGVYFEKVLKNTRSTLWTRNVQLSFFSLFPALFIGVLWQDGKEIRANGFFAGYNGLVWSIVLLQSLGGIIVAFCIKYADNIAKNFAASLSLLLSCLASALFFNTPLTTNFVFGTAIVLLAGYLYHQNR